MVSCPSPLLSASNSIPGGEGCCSRGPCRELCWRLVVQGAVRPIRIVCPPPLGRGLAGVGDTHKPVLIQALITKLTVETFDECILPRLARFDEDQFDSVRIRPLIQRLPAKLRSVVDDDLARTAALLPSLLQRPHHPRPRQQSVHFNLQTFPPVLVQNVQHPQPPTIGQTVGDKIHQPTLIQARRQCQRLSCHPCRRSSHVNRR